jgi:apolipoprotein N-acyltransferase
MSRGARWLAALRDAAPRLGCALLVGALAVVGRPGLDIWPLFFFGQWWLSVAMMRSLSAPAALALTAAWGLCYGAGVGIGAFSWGPVVPFGIALALLSLLTLPLAALARLARRVEAVPTLYAFVAGSWALWLSLLDRLGIGCRTEAMALLGAHPLLVLGARIVGANVLCGIIAGGLVASAAVWVRCLGAPLVYRLRRALQPVAVAVTLLLGLGSLASRTLDAPARELQVGVPQIDADAVYYQSRLAFPELARAFKRRLSDQLQMLAPAELVVFTETHDGGYGLMLPAERERWANAAKNRGQAWLTTSFLVEPSGLKSNALGAFTQAGELAGVHRKVELAPYGERSLAAGTSFEPLDLGDGTRVGALICNEAYKSPAVSQLVEQGANLLVASTSDVSFGSSVLVFEHVAAARLQAIEQGRDMIWASNAGPSAVLTREGRVQAAAPFRQPAALRSTARLFDGRTPYGSQGYVWLVLAAVLAGYGALSVVRGQASPAAADRSSRVWTMTLGALGLPALLAVTMVQPYFVELRHGDSRRAAAAVGDLFRAKPAIFAPEAEPDAPDSSGAQRAASYFARYYGAEVVAGGPDQPVRTLDELREQLRARFGLATTVIDLRRGVPRVATLVQLNDGQFVVTTRPEDDTIHAYQPNAAARQWDERGLLDAARHEALMPLPLTTPK